MVGKLSSSISLKDYWKEMSLTGWDVLWVVRWRTLTLLGFHSYRKSKSLQRLCPGALPGRHLSLRHHRHCLHHEEDGHVLGWSLQVRTGRVLCAGFPCSCRHGKRRVGNHSKVDYDYFTLFTGGWVFSGLFKDWRTQFCNLAWILP